MDPALPGNPFDAWLEEAVASRPLAALFASAFDGSAPEGVLGFSFVTMPGLRHIAGVPLVIGQHNGRR